MGKDKENMEKVTFRSFPEYYEKEKSGIKNNTVRRWEILDKRFEILALFEIGHIKELFIEIVNTETKESFIRKVRDVSSFGIGGVNFIITWDDKEVV